MCLNMCEKCHQSDLGANVSKLKVTFFDL